MTKEDSERNFEQEKEWDDLEKFTQKNYRKKKNVKQMQLRIPMHVYDKIRERSYLQRKSMQSIVVDLFEREFGK